MILSSTSSQFSCTNPVYNLYISHQSNQQAQQWAQYTQTCACQHPHYWTTCQSCHTSPFEASTWPDQQQWEFIHKTPNHLQPPSWPDKQCVFWPTICEFSPCLQLSPWLNNISDYPTQTIQNQLASSNQNHRFITSRNILSFMSIYIPWFALSIQAPPHSPKCS